MAVVVPVVGLAAALAVCVTASVSAVETAMAATAMAAPTPAERVASAISAGLAEKSVRWAATESGGGVTIRMVSNAGRSEGFQVITFTEGTTTEGTLSIVLVKGTVYLLGNGEGLYAQGFSVAAAKKEAGKWIALKPSSPGYASTAAGLTVASVFAPLKMAGPVTSVPGKKVLGTSTLGFKGTTRPSANTPGSQAAVAETLYVRASGKPLPAEAVQQNDTVEFADWGEPVKVTAPRGAVPLQASWLRAK